MPNLFGQKRIIGIAGRQYDYNQLDICFDIKFSRKSSDDVATVKIYNLNRESLMLFKQNQKINIIAGYDEEFGPIFPGVISSVETKIEGQDQLTKIGVKLNDGKWLKKTVNKTWGLNSDTKTIVTDLINMSGFKAGKIMINPSDNQVYRKGKTFSKTIKRALEELAKDIKYKLYTSNKRIYFLPRDKSGKKIVKLNVKTGLVGSPKEVDASNDNKTNKKQKLKIQSLLRYDIHPDTIIDLESRDFNGKYVVIKGNHKAEGINQFTTEIEVEKYG